MTAKRHEQVNYLDLDMSLQLVRTRGGATRRVLFRPYHKPGNAYAYIPFNSFHGRHTFRGWVRAELIRLLTHRARQRYGRRRGVCSTIIFAPEDSEGALRTVFQEVTWAQRFLILTCNHKRCDEFFKTYRACVLTLRNAPEWPALRERLDLSLNELTESTFGDIFPRRVFLAQSSAPRLGSILKR